VYSKASSPSRATAVVLGLVTLSAFVTLVRRHAASTVAALLLVVPALTAFASVPVLCRESAQAKTPAALAYSRSGSVGGVP
jgi:hypothetical protein